MSRAKIICCDCGKTLTKDEIGLTRKLIDDEPAEYYCLTCMSEYLGCSIEDLQIKIQEFKEQGCTLFL